MSATPRWQWSLLAALGLLLLYLLSPILTPFLLAALLAYMGDPLADRLQRWRLGRTSAVVVVFVLFSGLALLFLALLVPMVESQLALLVAKLPNYLARLRELVLPLLQRLDAEGVGQLDAEALLKNLAGSLQGAGNLMGRLWSTVSASGLAFAAWLANLLLVPVVTFYFLRDWDRMVAAVRELLPRRLEPVISRLSRESDEVLGAFLRGQLLVMLVLGLVYGIGLWLVGLDLAPLVGMIAGLVSFVPYLGFIVGIALAGVLALIQFHDLTHLLGVLAVFSVGQVLEGMLLTPWLVGERIGLHPVAVIFAVLAGGQLFGFFGVLLALPTAAVVMVWLRYVRSRYVASALYSTTDRDDPTP